MGKLDDQAQKIAQLELELEQLINRDETLRREAMALSNTLDDPDGLVRYRAIMDIRNGIPPQVERLREMVNREKIALVDLEREKKNLAENIETTRLDYDGAIQHIDTIRGFFRQIRDFRFGDFRLTPWALRDILETVEKQLTGLVAHLEAKRMWIANAERLLNDY